ncbi:hypothetical protein P9112_001852 [Eukaryota sp. TZLM1-RC]
MWQNKLRSVTNKVEKGLKSGKRYVEKRLFDVEKSDDPEFCDLVRRYQTVKDSVDDLEDDLSKMISTYLSLSNTTSSFTDCFQRISADLEVPRYEAFSERLQQSFSDLFSMVDENCDLNNLNVIKPLQDLTAQVLIVGAAVERHKDAVFAFDKARAKHSKLESQGHEVADKRYLAEIDMNQKDAMQKETREEGIKQLNLLFDTYEDNIDATLKNLLEFLGKFYTQGASILGSRNRAPVSSTSHHAAAKPEPRHEEEKQVELPTQHSPPSQPQPTAPANQTAQRTSYTPPPPPPVPSVSRESERVTSQHQTYSQQSPSHVQQERVAVLPANDVEIFAKKTDQRNEELPAPPLPQRSRQSNGKSSMSLQDRIAMFNQ